jgi:antitoxin ParD1/3/4
MNVSVGKHWEEFIDTLVKSGRYGSASEVIRQGLRHVEADEARLDALKDMITASLAEGGAHSEDEVMDYIRQRHAERKVVADAAE